MSFAKVPDDDHMSVGAVNPRRSSAAAWSAEMLRDLALWSGRRPLEPADGQRFIPHSADARMVVWAVAATDLVTGLPIDTIVPTALRALHILWTVVLLVLSLGFCAMTVRTPHMIDGPVLRIRTGPFRELAIPLTAVRSARRAHGSAPGHGLRRVPDDETAVACSVTSATSVVLELDRPVPVRLRRGGVVTAERVHWAADDPAAAVRLVNAAVT
ncbi:hypothetical protein AB0K09_00870 [Streptomyces sp. NPDC049577]|uniref:hypothetical protein n=1 Tax=Streptomyces sp. NPDC049577 TaxID=3155153 RepID=UPI00343F8F98